MSFNKTMMAIMLPYCNEWNSHIMITVMFRAIYYYKLSQNKLLKQKLLETEDNILAESFLYDNFSNHRPDHKLLPVISNCEVVGILVCVADLSTCLKVAALDNFSLSSSTVVW